MGIIRKLIHFLAIICYLLVLIYGIICIPMIFGYKPLVVLTGSMEPTIKTGSILYFKQVPESELKVGDPITFTLNGQYISHRIISIENREFETKGDNNDTPDPVKIRYSQIAGRDAKVVIPYIGYYVQFVNEHLYLMLVVIIILLSEFLIGKKRTLDINKNIVEEEEIL